MAYFLKKSNLKKVLTFRFMKVFTIRNAKALPIVPTRLLVM